MLPFWIKFSVLLFICLLVPVNWKQYGPANFLWFSDLALFLTGLGLWLENRLLIGMAALAVLLPEIAWNLDFFFRLISGKSGIGLSAYMFDRKIPPAVRSVSLFHIWLPILLLWLLIRLGYDPRALLWQSLTAFVVLPLSYWLGGPEMNVNWSYGFGEARQTWMPPWLFLPVMMIAFPAIIYFPTHLLLIAALSSNKG